MTLPLFERFPGTAALKRAGIADLPTPVDNCGDLLPLDDACEQVFPMHALFVKRDDLTSRVYGGNKVRKLDFLLGDAVAGGCRAVLTFGAYGSNHALATAVHARSLGLEPHVVLSPQEPGPFAPRTLLAHAALGSVIHLVEGWDGRREAVLARRALVERDGIEPYVIPMGGTCPLGAIGYVNAALEVAAQATSVQVGPVEIATSDFVAPDVVYVAAGTVGTAVGLALGFALTERRPRIEAVRVTPLELCNETVAASLVEETVAALRGLDPAFPALTLADLDFTLRHDFFEPGYGVPTPETASAVALAETGGLHLETTYTGKAFSAMLSDATAGRIRDDHVLFWDTYSSAPYPEAGDPALLPQKLQDYIAECRRLFPDAP